MTAYGYQYRGQSDLADKRSTQTRTAIGNALQKNRQSLSHTVAAIRAIVARRNEQIAEALWDGVRPRAVATAATTTLAEVRGIGLAFEDMHPTGTPADVHVTAIVSTTDQLHRAEADREELELQRHQVIATARKLRMYDEYEISNLTGMAAAEVKRTMRSRRAALKRPPAAVNIAHSTSTETDPERSRRTSH